MQAKIRGSYNHHLIIQASKRTLLNQILLDFSNSVTSDKNKLLKKVKWSIDVDPIDL